MSSCVKIPIIMVYIIHSYKGAINVHIIQVGFNYKLTPLEIREKFTFQEEEIANAMKKLSQCKSILENVIISTCNRTELYVVTDQLHTGRYYVKQFLADWFDISMEEFTPYLQILDNDNAIEHLFRVSSGLNSMVLGETQILGQVRDAFILAQRHKITGTIFNELFKQAITFAKRSHRETAIGENAVSISYAAVELAKQLFSDITNKNVTIFGAGEMGELAVQNLVGSGVNEITVINRSFENAEYLASKFNAKAAPIESLNEVLFETDILISSTSAINPVLSKKDIEPIQKKRNDRPLFLVDIAVPRDLDANISELENVFLYDIDDLQHIVDKNLAKRKEAAKQIELGLEYEIIEFKTWVQNLGVVPVLSALREKSLTIQADTFASINRKIPNLTKREQKVISKHTKSIINQMIKEPIIQAKEMAGKEDSEEMLSLFIDIFGIDDEVKNDVINRINKTKQISSLETSEEISYLENYDHLRKKSN